MGITRCWEQRKSLSMTIGVHLSQTEVIFAVFPFSSYSTADSKIFYSSAIFWLACEPSTVNLSLDQSACNDQLNSMIPRGSVSIIHTQELESICRTGPPNRGFSLSP